MRSILLTVALLFAGQALAHHPADRLDQVMGEKEPAFEITDLSRIPALAGLGTGGDPFDLGSFSDRIVVLSFVSTGCGAPCAQQQAVLTEVVEALSITPMSKVVDFVVVSDGGISGAEPGAANRVTVDPGDSAAVSALAARFAKLSSRRQESPQVHIIDRAGRHAGIFHGENFSYLNMVLYLNGLTNARPPEIGLLDRILGLIR
nr:SCO family protein [arsenite-oxidising bacterium NT-25]